MTTEYDYGRSGRRVLIIALCLSGAIFLLAVCACAGLIWWGAFHSSDLSGVRAAADGFLDDLKDGKIEEAYARTSKEFQKSLTLEQFRELLEHYPLLCKQRTRSNKALYIVSTNAGLQATFDGKIFGEGNSLDFTLTLVREHGEWKIEFLFLP